MLLWMPLLWPPPFPMDWMIMSRPMLEGHSAPLDQERAKKLVGGSDRSPQPIFSA